MGKIWREKMAGGMAGKNGMKIPRMRTSGATSVYMHYPCYHARVLTHVRTRYDRQTYMNILE